MKRLLFLFLILLVAALPIGCNGNTATEHKAPVEINIPQDNTVNGYRLESSKSENADDAVISADKVAVESHFQSGTDITESSTKYCANINSKVFHKLDCGAVKNMKEDNKFYLSDRNQLVADNYTPCKQCKP